MNDQSFMRGSMLVLGAIKRKIQEKTNNKLHRTKREQRLKKDESDKKFKRTDNGAVS